MAVLYLPYITVSQNLAYEQVLSAHKNLEIIFGGFFETAKPFQAGKARWSGEPTKGQKI